MDDFLRALGAAVRSLPWDASIRSLDPNSIWSVSFWSTVASRRGVPASNVVAWAEAQQRAHAEGPLRPHSWETANGDSWAQLADFQLVIVYAVCFCLLRLALDRFVFGPFARRYVVPPLVAALPPRPSEDVLRAVAATHGRRRSSGAAAAIAKRSKFDLKSIQEALDFLRAKADVELAVVKSNESFYKLVVYLGLWVAMLGALVLHEDSWLWDTDKVWAGFPHPISPKVQHLYLLEFAFYVQFLVFQDVKRKDAAQMFCHHLVTIGLVSLSYLCMCHRVGLLILLCHDFSDVFLEMAKLSKYAHCRKAIPTAAFVVFAVSFFASRLVYFPVVCIWSAWYTADAVLSLRWRIVSSGLLVVLQVLHVFWMALIVEVVIDTLRTGEVEDIREPDGSEEADDDESEAADDADAAAAASKARRAAAAAPAQPPKKDKKIQPSDALLCRRRCGDPRLGGVVQVRLASRHGIRGGCDGCVEREPAASQVADADQ